MEENLIKYENFRQQMPRLKRALGSHFYLEAIFIAYAILEERTEAILRYTEDLPKVKEGTWLSLERKVKKIEKLAENKKSLARKYFGKDTLLQELLSWKEERNKIIHALMKRNNSTEELSAIAVEGERLVKELNRRSQQYKRAFARAAEKEAKANA